MRTSSLIVLPPLVLGAAFFLACGDKSTSSRTAFADDDAGTHDAALPEASTDDGSKPASDAGDKRDPFDPADEPVTCAGADPCAKQLVAGRYHFCALMSDGTVRCWGDDEYGALGAGPPPKDPSTDDKAIKVVANVAGATQISAARATTCARLGDGSVSCWGSNSDGQLGQSAQKPTWDESSHSSATSVALADPVVRVDVGPNNACAILANGKATCWGTNEKAQLARPGSAFVMVPGLAQIDPLTVARTGLGDSTSFAVTTSGDVFSWGAVAGTYGYMSGRMSSITPDPQPNQLLKLTKVTSLAVSMSLEKDEGGPISIAPLGPIPGPQPKAHGHACALVDGEIYCWGRSDTAALCTGLPDAELLPAHAPIMKNRKAWPQQLAVGDEITCARMTDGSIQCCGASGRGRLGASFTELFSPYLEPVTSFTGHAVQVATSHRAVCALVQGGTVECWGSNEHGELGTGTTDEDPHPSPVKIAF